MDLEFGGNNYPRNELWVTTNDTFGTSSFGKSNIFSIVQDRELGRMSVFGTEYEPGDPGTAFLELVDAQGLAVNNAGCYLDIWSPLTINATHEQLIDTAPMFHLGTGGVYYYDFTVPNDLGVYMMAASCSYETLKTWVYDTTGDESRSSTRTEVTGSYIGDTLALNQLDDFVYTNCNSANSGGQKCDAYYDFNLSSYDLTNLTNLDLFYAGEATTTETGHFYAYNWTNSSYLRLPNVVNFNGFAAVGNPVGINDFATNTIPIEDTVSNDSIIRVRIVGVGSSSFTQYDNFVNINFLTAGIAPQNLKGSGEIHVRNYTAILKEHIDFHNNSIHTNVNDTRIFLNEDHVLMNQTIHDKINTTEENLSDEHDNILTQIATVAQQVWDYAFGRYINGEVA
jgi:hypothetical protein